MSGVTVEISACDCFCWSGILILFPMFLYSPTRRLACKQNWDDIVWPAGQVGYGRQIRASVSEEGVYTIHANYILGWLRVPDG